MKKQRIPKKILAITLSDFSDAQAIAPWAKDAMTMLVEMGTVTGSGGKLSPASTTTRAEMAQVLYKRLEH
ncbi:S-layer homology domain-containing protein [Anoxybacterium hadale]|uniref:S-layer homology domain-containing protein n=1 Tax=Anoxybacterium hadale TaxID=3408580 RepID=UPI003AFF8B38